MPKNIFERIAEKTGFNEETVLSIIKEMRRELDTGHLGAPLSSVHPSINKDQPTYFKIFDAVIHDSRLSVEEVDEISYDLIKTFSWIIPTKEVVNIIGSSGPIVEMGAGRGYWAKHYSKLQSKVHCYDLYPQYNTFHEIRQAGPHVLQNYNDDWTLLIVSPQYRSDMVLECLRYFQGNRFLYAGDTNFSMNLPSIQQELEENWDLVETFQLPNWPNSDNNFVVFMRKEDK